MVDRGMPGNGDTCGMGTLLCPEVIGRRVEWAALSAALDASARGAGSAVLLTGEAGVGKSRMERELRKRCVDRGGVALLGRAVDTATPTPFRPLSEALMAAYRAGVVADIPDVVAFRAALAPLLPGYPGGPRSGASVLQVAEGFLRVMRSIGREHDRGVVVVLEDLHWADAETLAVVEYLADNVWDQPILLVVTTRPDVEREAVRSVLSLVDRRVVARLHLARLTTAETVQMTRRCLGEATAPAEVLQLVADRADGLPFFVEELLIGLQSDGSLTETNGQWVVGRSSRVVAPVNYAESVRRRMGALQPRSRQLLVDAALLGRQIDVDLLAAAGGCDRAEVRDALRHPVAAGLLVDDGHGLRFRHALTRDVVTAGLRPDDRAARAGHVLEVLRATSSAVLEADGVGAADLAEWAGDRGAAARLLLAVARRALAQGALTSAESALRRAARLGVGGPVELEVLECLTETMALAGKVEEVFALGPDVLRRLDATGVDQDDRRRAAIHLALARSAVACTDWSRATRHLDRALAGVGDDDPAFVARVAAVQAVVAAGEYRHGDSAALAAAAVDAAGSSADPDLLCEALLVLGRCTRGGDLAGAERAFARARDVARDAGLTHLEARALAELGTIDFNRGGAPERLEAARTLARACGASETEAVAEQHLAVLAWNHDDVEVMIEHARAAIGIARRFRLGMLLPSALILDGCARALRGDTAAMEHALAEAGPLVAGDPTQTVALHAQARATCALAHDDVEAARVELAVAMAIVRSSRPAPVPMVGMAVLLAAVDGADTTEETRALRSIGYHHQQPLAALLLAADAIGLGHATDSAAATTMAQAIALLRIHPFLLALTLRQVAPRAAADGWGAPAAWLGTALEIFEERGLAEPARSVTAMLRQLSGGRPVRPAATDRRLTGDITGREQDVLDLVAEGLPNRSIAARLHMSPRTVEKHVERLLAKTGTTNRAQLATYAVRLP